MNGHSLRWSMPYAWFRVTALTLFSLFVLLFAVVGSGGEDMWIFILPAYTFAALAVMVAEFYHRGAVVADDKGIRLVFRGNLFIPWNQVESIDVREGKFMSAAGRLRYFVRIRVSRPDRIPGALWARIRSALVFDHPFELDPSYYGSDAHELAALLKDAARGKSLAKPPAPEVLRLHPSRKKLMVAVVIANIAFLVLLLVEAVVVGIEPGDEAGTYILMSAAALNAFAVLNVKPSFARLATRSVATVVSLLVIATALATIAGIFEGSMEPTFFLVLSLPVCIGAMVLALVGFAFCRPTSIRSGS